MNFLQRNIFFICILYLKCYNNCTGMINSFIHTVMYSHYLITSLKLCKPWWKKYLTQMQMLQFFMTFYHFAQLFWVEDCGYPKLLVTLLVLPHNVALTYLFGQFYYQSYVRRLARNHAKSRSSDSKSSNRISKKE